MKELTDSLTALRQAVDDLTTEVENMSAFENKSDIVINLDTIYNDLSYTMTLVP